VFSTQQLRAAFSAAFQQAYAIMYKISFNRSFLMLTMSDRADEREVLKEEFGFLVFGPYNLEYGILNAAATAATAASVGSDSGSAKQMHSHSEMIAAVDRAIAFAMAVAIDDGGADGTKHRESLRQTARLNNLGVMADHPEYALIGH